MAQQNNLPGRGEALDAFEQRLRALYDTHGGDAEEDSIFSAADFFATAPAVTPAPSAVPAPAVEKPAPAAASAAPVAPAAPTAAPVAAPAAFNFEPLDFSELDSDPAEEYGFPFAVPAAKPAAKPVHEETPAAPIDELAVDEPAADEELFPAELAADEPAPAPRRPAAKAPAPRPGKPAPARKASPGPHPAPRRKTSLREVSNAGEVMEADASASGAPVDEETEIARLTEALPSRKRPQPRPAEVRPKPKKAPAFEEPVKEKKTGFGTILLRILAVVLATALILSIGVFALVSLVINGPSPDAGKILVSSLNETSALKFVPYWFLDDDEVEAILHPPVEEVPEDTYRELSFAADTAAAAEGTAESGEPLVHVAEPTSDDVIQLLDISGSTYKGKLLIISDPSKVVVGTLDSYGGVGWYLTEFVEHYGALAATNAGGFYDPDGQGSGGIPDGLVMKNGAIAFGDPYSYYYNVIGFDADHILHVGNMKGQEAIDLGLQSAVSFTPGPVLIKDGVRQSGWNSSLNPRTCIGQTPDGTVLLAVIEGRHLDSMGASFDDLADLMESYGVVNAANLDGGSSSSMIYNGEQITKGSSIVGSRQMATAILVLP